MGGAIAAGAIAAGAVIATNSLADGPCDQSSPAAFSVCVSGAERGRSGIVTAAPWSGRRAQLSPAARSTSGLPRHERVDRTSGETGVRRRSEAPQAHPARTTCRPGPCRRRAGSRLRELSGAAREVRDPGPSRAPRAHHTASQHIRFLPRHPKRPAPRHP
jgi:hypothetical protein